MSAAGPSQGARPPRRGAARSDAGGEPPSAAGPSQGARPPRGGAARSNAGGEPPSVVVTDDVAIRALRTADLDRYHALRQRGLVEHPEAFTSSAEEERDAQQKLGKRLARDPAHPHDVVLGAFDGDALVGIIGMSVDARAKVRHRGHVFGMYVPRERTGRGVGEALVRALIAHARRCEGLDALVLTVTAGNDGAVRLYEHAGFVAFGREPGAVRVNGMPYDKLHMIRWLADRT